MLDDVKLMFSYQSEQGFTLIETLVALGIAAVALTALTGRLGISADTQRSLMAHATMLEVATNILEEQRFSPVVNVDDREGELEMRGMPLTWKLTSEKTEVDVFVRQNITVSAANEEDVHLFLYQIKP